MNPMKFINSGDAAEVSVGRHFNQVDTNDIAFVDQGLKDFQHVVIEEAGMAGCAGTWSD